MYNSVDEFYVGKRQGFRRWSDGGQMKGARSHQEMPWSSRC